MKFLIALSGALLLAACGSGAAAGTPIAEIQGAGTASPIDGQAVSTTGIVTGDFALASDLMRAHSSPLLVKH